MAIQTVANSQAIGANDTPGTSHQHQDCGRTIAAQIGEQNDEPDRCGHGNDGERGQAEAKHASGPAGNHPQFGFEFRALIRAQEADAGPVAHLALDKHALFIRRRVAAHSSRPHFRDTMTRPTVTAVAVMTIRKRAIVRLATWRSSSRAIPT